MRDPGGGGTGSGRFSAIHLGSFAEMISDLRPKGELLQTTGHNLQSALANEGLYPPELGQIVEIGAWIEEEIPMLQRRLSLGRAANQASGGGPWVVVDEPVRMPSAADRRAVRALADRVNLENRPESDTYREVAEALEPYLHDPALMAEFYGRLGVDSASLLAGAIESYGDDDADEVIATFSDALGTATLQADRSAAFQQMLDSFTELPDDPQDKDLFCASRLRLLQDGEFDPEFLGDAVYGNAFADLAATDEQWKLAFGALSGDIEATRVAMHGERMRKAMGFYNRLDAEELAESFEPLVRAASGVDQEAGDHDKAAARFALDFITSAAGYDEIPMAMQAFHDDLAASYIHEFVASADSTMPEDSVMRPPAQEVRGQHEAWGLNPQFTLSPEDIRGYLRGIGAEDSLTESFDTAAGELYKDALTRAAAADARHYEGHTVKAAARFGTLAGLEYNAKLDIRGEMDDHDQAMRSAARDVAGYAFGWVPGAKYVETGFKLGPEAAKLVWSVGSYAAGKGMNAAVLEEEDESRAPRSRQRTSE